MPHQLTAPDDLRALALPYWEEVSPDWDVQVLKVPAAEIGGGRGLTDAVADLRQAVIWVADHVAGQDLLDTLAHEFSHVAWWPVTSLLDHSDPKTRALVEPINERVGRALAKLPRPHAAALARVARSLPGRTPVRKQSPPAALAREGAPMDDIALILAAFAAALANADSAAAVAACQSLITEIKGMLPADAMATEEPVAPMDGEAPGAMMRRALPAALARRTTPAPVTLSDTGFASKVLARLGVKSEGEALLRIAALKISDSQVEDLSGAQEIAARKSLVIETMKRTGLARAAFYVDGKDELLPEWTEGTVEQMGRTLATLKRGGIPLARPRVEPDPETVAGGGNEIPAQVAEYARQRGITDPKKIKALAQRTSGGKPQEQAQ